MKLEIDGRNAGIKFSACHWITSHEKCGRLHGHSYAIHLQLYGEPGPDGILFDFLRLKTVLRDFAKELDHKVIVPSKCERIRVKREEDSVRVETDGKLYQFPVEDVVMLDIVSSSAEEIARYMLNRLTATIKFPSNIEQIEVGIEEERGQAAWCSKRPGEE